MSAHAPRTLILADFGGNAFGNLAHLLGEGWRIVRVRDVHSLSRLVCEGGCAAGVLDISSGMNPATLLSLEPILASPRIGWLLAMNGVQREDPLIRRLIRDYCFDYLTQPCPEDVLALQVGHAWGMACLAAPRDQDGTFEPAGRQDADGDGEDGMIGSSAPMQRLRRLLRRLSGSDAPVLLHGETGTGKELSAHAIHRRSRRSSGPFMAINCGAIPSSLVQAELFGYEKGAFTGATSRRTGRIEAASGGTLFLDEIGDLPLDSQATLLRFLQQGSIERLGGHTPIPVDVRIVSATHVDLEDAVEKGRFRSDLYHRLCVLRIQQPPLRERGEDIELIARHALRLFAREGQRSLGGFSPSALRAMHLYDWPGNVRELVNRVRHAVVMAEGRLITESDLSLPLDQQAPTTLEQARGQAEVRAIQQALRRNRRRLHDTARELGISRVTLYRIMCRHGIDTDSLDAVT